MAVRQPIMAASEGSAAIAATLTLAPGADAQLDALNVSAERELSRLVQAGIAMTASTSRLAALGYWNDLDQGSRWAPTQLCNNVIIETSTALSIPLTPYLLFLGVTILIAVISYADLLGANGLPVWRECADLWALYYVGQLHREVAEQLCGRLEHTHAGEEWPILESGHAGFNAAEKDGAKYLIPSAYLIARTLQRWLSSLLHRFAALEPESETTTPSLDPSLSAARLLTRHIMTSPPTIPLSLRSVPPPLPFFDSTPLMANVASTV
jgi:hypothetical protein